MDFFFLVFCVNSALKCVWYLASWSFSTAPMLECITEWQNIKFLVYSLCWTWVLLLQQHENTLQILSIKNKNTTFFLFFYPSHSFFLSTIMVIFVCCNLIFVQPLNYYFYFFFCSNFLLLCFDSCVWETQKISLYPN